MKRIICYNIGLLLICGLLTAQTNEHAIHCMANGHYCVFQSGADINQLFGPEYSSPQFIKMNLANKDIKIASKREYGTAIWHHKLTLGDKLIAEITDFVDSESPVFVRKINASESFSFVLNVYSYPEISTYFNKENFEGDFAEAFLIHKDRGVRFQQKYEHPYEQFHQLLLKGNAIMETTDKSDFFNIVFESGQSEVLFIGGPDYRQCIENTKEILTLSSDVLYDRTKKNWMDFTARRKDFAALIPESNTHKKAILEQIDNVAIILKTQQATEGAVIAGRNYHNAYVRDQYGVSRGFLALGYTEEARQILDFYWGIWQQFGVIQNAQAVGIPGVFHIHENDEVEQTGYLIIQAFDYLEQTGDEQFVKTIFPMLNWAWEAQKKHLVKNMLPFNGDETYVAGGLLPRTALNDGSAESTLLFIKSGELLIEFAQKNNLWENNKITGDKRLIVEVTADFRDNFIREGKLITNNPKRITIDEMPAFRQGVCIGNSSHGVLWTQKDKNGNYLCTKCFAEKHSMPPYEPVEYFLPSIALTPIFIHSEILADDIKNNVDEIRKNYMKTGTVTSVPGKKRVIGYEYGFLLYAFCKYEEMKAAEKVFKDMMSVVDDAGAWVEYYDDGEPTGCPYRPWESAINITAIIDYALK